MLHLVFKKEEVTQNNDLLFAGVPILFQIKTKKNIYYPRHL